MTAVLVLHTKEIRGDEIVEIKIWQVPRSKAFPHGVRYSIAYIRDGKRLLAMIMAKAKDITGITGAKKSHTISLIFGTL